MSDSSDFFEVIDSQYELIEQSISDPSPKKKEAPVFRASIKPSKNQVDLSLLESQYYEFEIFHEEVKKNAVQRRYSEFALIYDVRSPQQRYSARGSPALSSPPSLRMGYPPSSKAK